MQELGTRLAVDTWSGTTQEQGCGFYIGWNCDRPLRAGVRLFNDDLLAVCTTGFNARDLSTGYWYVMTAGHCGVVGDRFWAYQPDRTGKHHLIGPVSRRRDVGYDDFAIIKIENQPGWDPRAWVYVHASSDTVLNLTYYINGTATSPEGTRACISGSQTATLTNCGKVIRLNYGEPGGFARASYCSQGGDSGAPIYSGHKARGIHVAATDSDCRHALYQGVREAAKVLRVRLLGT